MVLNKLMVQEETTNIKIITLEFQQELSSRKANGDLDTDIKRLNRNCLDPLFFIMKQQMNY